MQTTSQQHRSSPSAGFVPTSATLQPQPPPYTTSSATATAATFGSPTQRRRPGTSSGSAAVDGLVEPAPVDHGPSFTDPFLDDAHASSPRSTPRRPFAFGLGGGSGGAESATLFRKKSFARKPSLGDLPSSYSWQKHNQTHSLPPTVPRFKGFRRALSSTNLRGDALGAGLGIGAPPRTDTGNPPALPPEYALSSNPKLSISSSSGSRDHNNTSPRRTNPNSMESSRMMPTRQGTMPLSGSLSGGAMMAPPSVTGMQSEAVMVHQHIQEMANKRISTLEYLRKAHEGRVHWFNTLLFDKPDLARMSYYDARRLARRATNYLLLGLSLPTVIDVNANSPIDFLRSLNLLLSEFDAFQSLHPENGSSASGLGRARIPNLNVFRRATPSKSRRSSSAATDVLYEDGAPSLPGTNGSIGGGGGVISNISSSAGGSTSIMNGLGGSASVVSFGQSEADLLPGEEYVHLLTPSLPFDPDFFETFATLCDVLIDAYTRLLGLLPTPRECNAAVAELFTKADARVRKIIVQGIVKEFEDTSRNGVRSEVANVGKIVLGGLM